MKCVICKHAQLNDGMTTVTLEHGPTTLVFKDVPARICSNCGEKYVDAETTARILKSVENATGSGAEVEVRHYAP
jgi:YgiT-type zinc finger domain-containing protein